MSYITQIWLLQNCWKGHFDSWFGTAVGEVSDLHILKCVRLSHFGSPRSHSEKTRWDWSVILLNYVRGLLSPYMCYLFLICDISNKLKTFYNMMVMDFITVPFLYCFDTNFCLYTVPSCLNPIPICISFNLYASLFSLVFVSFS